MRSIISLIALLATTLSFGQSAIDSVKTWLAPGEYDVSLMNGYDIGPRGEILSYKMMMGVQSNQEWYIEYVKTIPDGATMPYHENLGLTEEEYEELLGLYDKVSISSTAEGTLDIVHENGKVRFRNAIGSFVGLLFLEYDLTANTFIWDLGDDEPMPPLVLTDTIDTRKDAKPPYKTSFDNWHGFSWEYREGEISEDITSFEEISYLHIDVTAGKSDVDGAIILQIKFRGAHNGEATMANEMPLLLRPKKD